MRRRIGSTLVAALFALMSAVDVWQLGQAAAGPAPGSAPSLLVTHGVTGALAAAAAVGSWRVRRWAAGAALGWGGVTAAMLVARGPVLDMPQAERPQLSVMAAVVAIAAGAAAWYLSRHALAA